MTALVVIAIVAGYFAGVGATFQLAATLEGPDMYGQKSNSFRWFASCFWPIAVSIAVGVAIAQWFQERRERPPRAIASERKAKSR